MVEVKRRIDVEVKNIERIIALLPVPQRLPGLSQLELAGVATLLHNFYNGLENILKQLLIARSYPIPTGPSWHKELIDLAASHGIISQDVHTATKEYLAFRHFFSHAYALDLFPHRMEPLVAGTAAMFSSFIQNVYTFLSGNEFNVAQ